jgi:hypothetical protein
MLTSIVIVVLFWTNIVICGGDFTPVAHFQENGQFSKSTVLEYNITGNPTLTNFTVCITYWLRFLRSAWTNLAAYGNVHQGPDFIIMGTIQG